MSWGTKRQVVFSVNIDLGWKINTTVVSPVTFLGKWHLRVTHVTCSGTCQPVAYVINPWKVKWKVSLPYRKLQICPSIFIFSLSHYWIYENSHQDSFHYKIIMDCPHPYVETNITKNRNYYFFSYFYSVSRS